MEEDPSYFYNILPYAYVMGLTDKWIKAVENIAVPPADWYDGGRSIGQTVLAGNDGAHRGASYVYVLFTPVRYRAVPGGGDSGGTVQLRTAAATAAAAAAGGGAWYRDIQEAAGQAVTAS